MLAVACAEALNEPYDIRSLGVHSGHESPVPDSIHDFVLTMLRPVPLPILVPLFQGLAKRQRFP